MRSAATPEGKTFFLRGRNTILRETEECTHADQNEENIAEYLTEFRRVRSL